FFTTFPDHAMRGYLTNIQTRVLENEIFSINNYSSLPYYQNPKLLPGFDVYNQSSQVISNIQGINGGTFKMAAAIANNPKTLESFVVSASWDIGFLQKMFQDIVVSVPYGMILAAFESQTGNLIGLSSNSTFTATLPTLFQTTDPLLTDFGLYINNTYPPPALAINNSMYIVLGTELSVIQWQMQQILAQLQNGPITINRVVSGATYAVQINQAVITWDRPWIIIQYLNLDNVKANLNAMSTKVAIIVLAVIVITILIGVGFAVLVAKHVTVVTMQVRALKELKFEQVLEKEKGVKNRSFMRELAILQQEFFEMVTIFAQQLKTSKSLTNYSHLTPSGSTKP
ncbi:hypothetical protein HK100_007907, partial [Physocladia obscura]